RWTPIPQTRPPRDDSRATRPSPPRAPAEPPPMDNLLSLAFEAYNIEQNHHRHYAVTLGRDLLDHWTVANRDGRTGQAGQDRRYADDDAKAIQAIIRDRLRRRLSAPRRIGCAYPLAAYSAAPGFDAAAWLPGEVMARFFDPSIRRSVLVGLD